MNKPNTSIDFYEPDYTHQCEVCGQSPVVTAVADGKVVLELGLCGPCTWGQAAMLDSDKWNDPDKWD